MKSVKQFIEERQKELQIFMPYASDEEMLINEAVKSYASYVLCELRDRLEKRITKDIHEIEIIEIEMLQEEIFHVPKLKSHDPVREDENDI